MYVHPHACSGCRHRCSMQSSVRVQAPMLNVVVALGTPNRDDCIRHHGAQHAYQQAGCCPSEGRPSVCATRTEKILRSSTVKSSLSRWHRRTEDRTDA